MILIGGDFFPLEDGRPLRGDLLSFFDPTLQGLIKRAESIVVNLEGPVTNSTRAIPKCGPKMKLPKQAISQARNMGINAFSLANNHIWDFGERGLNDTIVELERQSCRYWGASCDASQVHRAEFFPLGDKSLAILSIAEHEFSVASELRGGAYGFDVLLNAEQIRALRSRADFVVVLFHGGVEHYRLPTPKQQRALRHFIAEGADVVVCQHSHIMGAVEDYMNGVIFYGQGNFMFPAPRSLSSERRNTWNRGFLISLECDQGKLRVERHFFNQCASGGWKAEPQNDDELMLEQELRKIVGEKDLLFNEWSKFVCGKSTDYWSRLYGWSRIRRVVSRMLGIKTGTSPSARWAIIRNVVECESHREALETLWQIQSKDQ